MGRRILRRRFDDATKRRIVRRFNRHLANGGGITTFSRQAGIGPTQLRVWRRQFGTTTAPESPTATRPTRRKRQAPAPRWAVNFCVNCGCPIGLTRQSLALSEVLT